MDDMEICKTLTLTRDQLYEIEDCMAIVRTRYERDRKGWTRLSFEKNPDGTPRFKHAESNAEYLDMKISRINEIIKVLDGHKSGGNIEGIIFVTSRK